jgi:hypothetical protein
MSGNTTTLARWNNFITLIGRNILIIDNKAFGIHHLTPISAKVLSLTSGDDPHLGYFGCYQLLGFDQVLLGKF